MQNQSILLEIQQPRRGIHGKKLAMRPKESTFNGVNSPLLRPLATGPQDSLGEDEHSYPDQAEPSMS